MFPTVRVSFMDLDPDASYAVLLDIVPLDAKRHRYSYSDSAWFVAGEADAVPPKVTCVHPDSPFTGRQLQGQVLSFEKVKLTNNRDDKRGNVSARHPVNIYPSVDNYYRSMASLFRSSVHCLSDQEIPSRGSKLFRLLALSSVLFVVLIRTKKTVYISTNYFLINRTSGAIRAIKDMSFL